MAPKTSLRRFAAGLSLLLLLGAAFIPNSVSATPLVDPPVISDLATFAASVVNSEAGVVAGAYADGLFALPIVQQPGALAGYVSEVDNTLTQFGWPQLYGIVGLLAHNYLSGQYFFQIWAGQRIDLIYGDGRIESYRVTAIYRYRATAPFSVHSDFVDLDTKEYLSAEGLFMKVYKGKKHVTFQTCIAKDGNSSWGRLFVIAVPEETLRESLSGSYGEIEYFTGAERKSLEYVPIQPGFQSVRYIGFLE